MNQLTLLIKKEIKQEFRSRETVISMSVFGVVVILLFAFAFNAAPAEFQKFLPGLIWMTYLFVAVLGLQRSFAAEKELDAYAALLSAPIDRGLVYLGKLTAFVLFMAVAQAVTLPLFGLFLNLSLSTGLGMHLVLCLLTDWAMGACGVLISGMGLRIRMGEVLIPILLFPLLVPVLIGATKASAALLSGAPFSQIQMWFMIIATFAVLFTVTGLFAFGAISEE